MRNVLSHPSSSLDVTMLWKIMLMWAAFLALHFLSLLLPHRQYSELGSVNLGLQWLIFLLCFRMTRRDVREFKPALINLAVLFGFSILQYLSIFVGPVIFRNETYASVYYHEYVNKFGHTAILALAVLYLIVEYRFLKWSTLKKYAVTISIAGLILIPLYYPCLKDPLQLYRTEEYSGYLAIKSAHDAIQKERGGEPTQAEVVEKALTSRKQQSGALTAEDIVRERNRLNELTRYLENGGDLILFWKPLNLNTVYANGALVAFIFGFYILKFRRDTPHGAYFEKIIFLFLIFCSLEALHSWTYAQSVNTALYYSIHDVAQYLIIAVLLGFVYVCSVRLRFLLSPVGQYYERQIILQPERISRWRDEIDRLVLRSFLQKTPFVGRLGTLEPKEKTQQPNTKGEV